MFLHARRGLCLLAAVCCLMLAAAAAGAEEAVLALPAGTLEVEQEAFLGSTSLREVRLPDGLQIVGPRAFADCINLEKVVVPASVEAIGEDAIPAGVFIECEDETWAEVWADENGYPRPKRYYALLVGQEYIGKSKYLPGCFRDVDGMQAMLGAMTATPYRVTVEKDLTADELRAAVETAFADADEGDVCLFQYSGHGSASTVAGQTGAMIGVDNAMVTLGELKALLGETAADKIVIMDSCYSGAAIGKSVSAEPVPPADLQEINAAVVGAFASASRSEMAEGGYYVLTAASQTEKCVSGYGGSSEGEPIYFGAFTCGLLHGCGYDEINAVALDAMKADKDGDAAITLAEAYAYAYARAMVYNTAQHAQCWPDHSAYVLWAK